MNTTSLKQYRQGDVLIEGIARIDNNGLKQSNSALIMLARGEATGHHHALRTDSPVESWLEVVEMPSGRHQAGLIAVHLYLSLPAGGVVEHPEHAAIELPAGHYRITRQREYSPEAIHDVAD